MHILKGTAYSLYRVSIFSDDNNFANPKVGPNSLSDVKVIEIAPFENRSCVFTHNQDLNLEVMMSYQGLKGFLWQKSC